MKADDFQALKATMPWTDHSTIVGRQTRIQIIDKHGQEVPLLTMVEVVKHLTAHIARSPNSGENTKS